MSVRRLSLVLLLAGAAPVAAQEQDTRPSDQGATGAILSAEGVQLGNVAVATSPFGQTLVTANAEGFPQGVLAVHLHETGVCEGPDFESAGGHLGGETHGILVEGGPHAGDLPNVHVQEDGMLVFDAFASEVTEAMLFDADGTALIIHAGRDDYASQPAGDSGARIACAVLQPAPGTRTDDTVDPPEAEDDDTLIIIE